MLRAATCTSLDGGKFTYTPTVTARQTAARTGATAADKVDTFTVTVDDGHGHAVAQLVTVKVSPLKVAATVTHTNLNTGIATGVITTADPGVFTYKTTTSRKGTLVVAPDGTFTYTPTAAARTAAANPRAFASAKTDSYTITLTDAAGKRSTVKLSAAIAPAGHVNQAPVANNHSYTTAEDTALTIAAPGLLSTDTDADGDTLTVAYDPVHGTAHGSVVLNANGSFTYTPNVDYSGADSFTYRAFDGTTNSALATVTITVTPVNDAPTAGGGSAIVTERHRSTTATCQRQ